MPIEIHNHIGTNVAPLSDQGGQRTLNGASSTSSHPNLADDSDTDDFLVVYPSIALALRELHAAMPEAGFRSYETAFREHGMYYVDAAQ